MPKYQITVTAVFDSDEKQVVNLCDAINEPDDGEAITFEIIADTFNMLGQYSKIQGTKFHKSLDQMGVPCTCKIRGIQFEIQAETLGESVPPMESYGILIIGSELDKNGK